MFHNPDAGFTVSPTQLCAPGFVTVNDTSVTGDNLSYVWQTNPTTPFANINDPLLNTTTINFVDNINGTSDFYDIYLTITDTRGCIDNDTFEVELWTRPISNFSITDSGCGPITYNTTNTTLYATSYNWTVISTDTSFPASIINPSDFEPTITFPENTTNIAINYTISLVSTTDNGCTDTTTRTVTIYPTPNVSFNADTNVGCGPLTVNFTNTSDPYNGEDTTSMSFDWYINNILQTGTTNFTYTFPNIPEDTICYYIMLTGTTSHGCDTSFIDTIYVYPDPIATIEVNGLEQDSIPCLCAPLEINTLGITAVDYPQANSGINWTVVNSTGNIVANTTGFNCPSWNISDQNDYVWIYIEAYNDCDTVQDSLYVCTIEDPVAAFELDTLQGCHPLTVNIDTTGTTQNAGYTWDVIDQNGQTVQTYNTHQNSITLNNTSHTTDLTYTIRLTVGDPSTGCDSILTSDTIVVFHNPDAGFTVSPTQLCAPGFVTVNDTSVTGDNLSYV